MKKIEKITCVESWKVPDILLYETLNRVIDALNELQGEACEHEGYEGVVGLSVNGEKPESGFFCSKCGEYISTTSCATYPEELQGEEKTDRICVRCGALETEAKEIDCIVGGNCYDKHDFAEEKPEELYIGTEEIKEPRSRKLTEQEFQDIVDRYTQPEEFTLEELKVIKMSLDGLGANDICTLLDEESFDNTREKVITKLKPKE